MVAAVSHQHAGHVITNGNHLETREYTCYAAVLMVGSSSIMNMRPIVLFGGNHLDYLVASASDS